MMKQLVQVRKDSQGFTLVELMIVVAIIGILAAIAMPQLSQLRIKGSNASAQSDVRNLAITEAVFFADWQRHGASAVVAAGGGGGAGALLTGPGGAATLITATVDGINQTLQIGLGNLVSLTANTNAAIAGPPAIGVNTTFTGGAKHQSGNTIFGIDDDTTVIYRNTTALGVGAILGAGTTHVPAPLVGDDFAAVANWVAQ